MGGSGTTATRWTRPCARCGWRPRRSAPRSASVCARSCASTTPRSPMVACASATSRSCPPADSAACSATAGSSLARRTWPHWSPTPSRCCGRPADLPSGSSRTAADQRVAWCPTPPARGGWLVSELGPNAFGEPVEPGRVDCYLGLPLLPQDEGGVGGVLVVAPRWLLHPAVPQPAGSLVYELATGHPDRQPGELVFPADLTVELRVWPQERWAALGVDLDQVAAALVGCWQRGDVRGLHLPLEAGEDPQALVRPAMTLARAELRERLERLVARARRRWLHPTSGRRPGERFL